MTTTFKTNPVALSELLKDCARGDMQLPDFQRSWVWDDERIQSLIASISQAFPVGALMTLKTGGEVNFHPRPIQGVALEKSPAPASLLLDGQQRMTSLYQALVRREVIHTRNAKGLAVDRFYYLDMRRALDPAVAREEAIVAVDREKTIKGAFGKVERDLSSEDAEFDQLMFPLNRVFDKARWQIGFWKHWIKRDRSDEMETLWQRFDDEVLAHFEGYLVPVIELGAGTSREAICLVFEKVNTGGKALDAFELVTAIYPADGFRLRDDWAAREKRLHAFPVLKSIGAIDFLQAISLLHSAELRAARASGDGDPPPISATRASLLRLPLAAFRRHAEAVERGFVLAAKFLRRQRIYRVLDLPYRSQLVPLAATLADDPAILDHAERFDRLSRWYWCGVFGELYGGATETRMAKDYAEVGAWTAGHGGEPTTVADASFRADRLLSMTSRLSAAYKGVNARLMDVGALDFRSGQPFEQTMFFDESVDIHHVFPRAWCLKQGIRPAVFNSILNKTPLSAKTNRILGGVAPSLYLSRLEKGGPLAPAIAPDRIAAYLSSHGIRQALLAADDFDGFMADRREALIVLIETAMGKPVYRDHAREEGAVLDDGDEEATAIEALAA